MRQSEVARRISGRPSHSLISQLETGRLNNPTVGLLSIYLMAIGASWSEIVDLLDRHTAQLTAPESDTRQKIADALTSLPRQTAMAIQRYDRSSAHQHQNQGRPPEPVELRTRRARKLAAAHEQRRRLQQTLQTGVDSEGLGTTLNLIQRHHLLTFGQKLWGILSRTRKRATGRRESLLQDATDWIRQQHVLPEPAIEWTHRATIKLFQEQERKGELDRLPRTAASHNKPGPRQYRQQRLQQHQRRLQEYQRARSALIAKLWSAVRQMLTSAGIEKRAHPRFLNLLRHTCYAIDWFESTSRQQQELENYLGELARHQSKPEAEFARRVAKTVAVRYRRLRTLLPPNPLAPSRH